MVCPVQHLVDAVLSLATDSRGGPDFEHGIRPTQPDVGVGDAWKAARKQQNSLRDDQSHGAVSGPISVTAFGACMATDFCHLIHALWRLLVFDVLFLCKRLPTHPAQLGLLACEPVPLSVYPNDPAALGRRANDPAALSLLTNEPAPLGLRPYDAGSSGPSSISIGAIMLDWWLVRGVFGRTSRKGPDGNGGRRILPASRSLDPTAASLAASFSLTVCRERSSRASCTVNHDCFFTTPLTLEGFDPIVGGWKLCAAIWSCVLPLFLDEPGTSWLKSGFIVVTLAQTMPVLTSIMDQKSIATLL